MFYSFLLCFSMMMMPSRKSAPTTTNNSTRWLKRTTSLYLLLRFFGFVFSLSLWSALRSSIWRHKERSDFYLSRRKGDLYSSRVLGLETLNIYKKSVLEILDVFFSCVVGRAVSELFAFALLLLCVCVATERTMERRRGVNE